MSEGMQVECIEMMDKKVKPVYLEIGKKLDKWVFGLIFIPSILLCLALILITYRINASSIEKYDGMELRLVEKIQEMKDDITDKIEKLNNANN